MVTVLRAVVVAIVLGATTVGLTIVGALVNKLLGTFIVVAPDTPGPAWIVPCTVNVCPDGVTNRINCVWPGVPPFPGRLATRAAMLSTGVPGVAPIGALIFTTPPA